MPMVCRWFQRAGCTAQSPLRTSSVGGCPPQLLLLEHKDPNWPTLFPRADSSGRMFCNNCGIPVNIAGVVFGKNSSVFSLVAGGRPSVGPTRPAKPGREKDEEQDED